MTYQDSNRIPADRKLLARLFSKIRISTTNFHNGSPCWEWQRQINVNGYGVSNLRRKPIPAHRLIYEIIINIIPKFLVCDHLCRNRKCVNPAHIDIVTAEENISRGESPSAINKTKTHCKRGHPFIGDNIRPGFNSGGRPKRSCRICDNAIQKAYRQRQNQKRRPNLES